MSSILLINTSYPDRKYNSYTRLSVPLGLLSIASPLRNAGFDVDLIDPQIDRYYYESITDQLKKIPLFVGMTIFMGTNIINAIELSKYIKKITDKIPIIWGGPLATSAPEICFNNAPIDYIVMGMGEKTIVEVAFKLKKNKDPKFVSHVSYLEGNIVKKKSIYMFSDDIDRLHYPQLDMWQKGIDIINSIPILSSRGCPRNCAFCYNNTFSGRKKWYGRTAQNVLDEMGYWANFYKKNSFYFIDDNFLVNTKRAREILLKSKERNYLIDQVIGHVYDFKPEILQVITEYIHHVGFSIESASKKIQKLLNKSIDLDKVLFLIKYLSENQIKVITTNFMFGLPTETDEDIQINIEMALQIRKINKEVRIIPYIYTPQPQDDIIPQFDFFNNVHFTIEALSTIDLAPNRCNILSHEIRPWMDETEILFYLDLVHVWFFHFDHVVRESQMVDIEKIFMKNNRLYKLFKNVPMPV